MFLGVFLTTGFLAVGAVTLLDLIMVNTIIIPLEERELLARFGADYEAYRRRVPRIMPRFARKTG
jgi:protein-S-isoprenylcysteine O-methyltransferase Ste14